MAENVFTKKLGPLPTWGWMAVGTAVLLFMGTASKQKSQQQASTAPAISTTSGPANAMNGYLAGGNGGNQWTSNNSQYGHSSSGQMGNGWSGKTGYMSTTPPTQHVRNSVTVSQETTPTSNTPWNSTLYGISQHTGTPLSDIYSDNPGIQPRNLQQGQQVKL